MIPSLWDTPHQRLQNPARVPAAGSRILWMLRGHLKRRHPERAGTGLTPAMRQAAMCYQALQAQGEAISDFGLLAFRFPEAGDPILHAVA